MPLPRCPHLAEAPVGFKKLFFVFTVWGSFPAPFLLTATVLVSILGTFFVPKLRPGGAHKNVFLARFVCEKNNIWPQSNLFWLSPVFQTIFYENNLLWTCQTLQALGGAFCTISVELFPSWETIAALVAFQRAIHRCTHVFLQPYAEPPSQFSL